MAYNQAEIDKMLKLHEGSEYNDRGQMISYMDTEDHLTVGYGHKVLKGDKDMFGMPITSTNLTNGLKRILLMLLSKLLA